MKVLHLSTYDTRGGAARGAYWLHSALQRQNVDSRMLVAAKFSADPTVSGPPATITRQFQSALRATVDRLPVKAYRRPANRVLFSPSWVPSGVLRDIRAASPDIVNLHWVADGFIRPETLTKLHLPLVWTPRDMWPFTGGCHYSLGCERFAERCGRCPALSSSRDRDLSRWLWKRKQRAWQDIDLTVVGLSNWIADNARRSSLFADRRIEVIHNALDEAIFKPAPKAVARQILNLPADSLIITFGAMNALSDPIKGFTLLQEALQRLSAAGFGPDAHVVVFGALAPSPAPDLRFPVTYLGVLHDDATLALAYSAADVMVVPSRQESFGKTALEALACGTPVVCFDTSGLKDVVEHKEDGYRATCYDTNDLAAGIVWVCQEPERYQALSRHARRRVEEGFTLTLQAQRYRQLYEDLLDAQAARHGAHPKKAGPA